MPNCTKCGARVDADDEFCPECGAKIRAQPTEALPARQAMLIAVQPKKHWFLKTVLIFIIIIFLVRACANFASEPQVYRPIQEVAAPAESDRLISIETPPPRVNPIPWPEPLPPPSVTNEFPQLNGYNYYPQNNVCFDAKRNYFHINITDEEQDIIKVRMICQEPWGTNSDWLTYTGMNMNLSCTYDSFWDYSKSDTYTDKLYFSDMQHDYLSGYYAEQDFVVNLGGNNCEELPA